MLPDYGPELTVKEEEGAFWLIPQREIDIYAANVLSKYVNEGLGDRPDLPVVFDLSKVSYINSTALGVVVGLIKIFQEKQVNLYFLKPTKFVRDLFESTGLNRIAQICSTKRDLPESIRKSRR